MTGRHRSLPGDIETGELVIMSTLANPGVLPLARTSWLTDVRLSEAIRASISIPGVFVPKRLDGRKLVDGAVRDMVPTAVLRALGADLAASAAGAVSHHPGDLPHILW